MTASVALLRGINVGGKNVIRMADLVRCMEGLGYAEVRTYLQSGNVLLAGGRGGSEAQERRIEQALETAFGAAIPVVLRTREEMVAVVAQAPPGHGGAELRSDVFFLKRPLTAAQALEQLPALREGVDRVASGPDVLYFSRLDAMASKSRMSKVMSLPMYRQMTVRNWNTVTNVLRLLETMAG